MIDIKDVTSGKIDGKVIWICDLRYNDFSKKPIRHVKPEKVLVRSNEDTKKRVYYSKSHFVSLNKLGEPINTKIKAPFDNTGYRSYMGTPLNCFDTEGECLKHYYKQVREAIKGLTEYKDEISSYTNAEIDNLEKLIK